MASHFGGVGRSVKFQDVRIKAPQDYSEFPTLGSDEIILAKQNDKVTNSMPSPDNKMRCMDVDIVEVSASHMSFVVTSYFTSSIRWTGMTFLQEKVFVGIQS